MISQGPACHPRWGHEPETASIRGLMIVVGFIVVGALAALIGVYLLYLYFQRGRLPPPPIVPSDVAGFAGSSHWTTHSLDLRQTRLREDAALSGHALADPQRGTVRIPIERAMELVASGRAPAPARGRPAPPR